ncbi:MAG: AEC family transporter [Pseudomonadota bacterium]
MIEIFLETLPFFLLLGLGYGAARAGLFGPQAVAALTRFVFFFALSAMLFNFAATLPFGEIFDPALAAAYFLATAAVYVLVTIAARRRGAGIAEAAVEAQCGVIGNVGFLGLPMLVLLMGEAAAGPILMILSIDLILFGSLLVILLVGARGRAGPAAVGRVLLGLVQNPMVMSISVGLIWSALALPVPGPAADFLDLLGAAATPGALFAIGASLAARSAERLSVALWLSFAKLALHPALAAVLGLFVFGLPPFTVAVLVAVAAMPTAGNVYIVAQHYGVAPMRASSTILVSTAISVVTLSAVIALVR